MARHSSPRRLAGKNRRMKSWGARDAGIAQPIELPSALVAGRVPAHVTQSLSMGSPSDR